MQSEPRDDKAPEGMAPPQLCIAAKRSRIKDDKEGSFMKPRDILMTQNSDAMLIRGQSRRSFGCDLCKDPSRLAGLDGKHLQRPTCLVEHGDSRTPASHHVGLPVWRA